MPGRRHVHDAIADVLGLHRHIGGVQPSVQKTTGELAIEQRVRARERPSRVAPDVFQAPRSFQLGRPPLLFCRPFLEQLPSRGLILRQTVHR
jgi:hypothetical protein